MQSFTSGTDALNYFSLLRKDTLAACAHAVVILIAAVVAFIINGHPKQFAWEGSNAQGLQHPVCDHSMWCTFG